MAALRGIVLAVVLGTAVALKTSQPHPPPEPVGDMPDPDKDGAYKSKADACSACKFSATGSCAMYKTCVCHATNAYFGAKGIPEPTDQDNWHWACAADGGPKYKLCFEVTSKYQDAFGDKTDPNNPKCPE
eukprot:gnl/TRDRNA2_/TRDRNA2_170518_c1_seq4.p1 gnl/TRDRNA2_/TRDRNA2_170518_c1~~gnl/TRDRNA2_/TRDRNA2_170518_c1_seq4.p1  ORF type:complete len:130 (-),score=29.64 gnl/TRDRNA2_/TRDRNA2_170518_c1_seq4:79-468(-)